MTRANPGEASRGHPWRQTFRAAELISLALILAVASGTATARGSPKHLSVPASTGPGSSTFCTAAAAFGRTTTNLFLLAPKALKAERAKFSAARAGLQLLAPRSITHDLQKIFAFDNLLFTGIAKVGWRIANVSPATLAQWTIKGRKLKQASDAVIGYLNRNCGLRLANP